MPRSYLEPDGVTVRVLLVSLGAVLLVFGAILDPVHRIF